tara:strand:+ start:8164 stop:8682 length:519 start_codon:yes stop_codon:yes gene_type:complete
VVHQLAEVGERRALEVEEVEALDLEAGEEALPGLGAVVEGHADGVALGAVGAAVDREIFVAGEQSTDHHRHPKTQRPAAVGPAGSTEALAAAGDFAGVAADFAVLEALFAAQEAVYQVVKCSDMDHSHRHIHHLEHCGLEEALEEVVVPHEAHPSTAAPELEAVEVVLLEAA